MKKELLFLISTVALTGCSLSFVGDEYEEGFSDGQNHDKRTVEYFDGDQIATDELTKHVISFKENDQNSQIDLKNFDEIKTVMTDNDSFVTNVENIKNVGQYHALKVGNASENADGGLKFTFASEIKAVEIIAQPRWSTIYSGLAETVTIDTNVAINANGSKYVKIKSDFTSETDIVPTTAKFAIGESINYLDINVVFQRIEILQINIYE